MPGFRGRDNGHRGLMPVVTTAVATGGLIVAGRRYSVRFAWTDDLSLPDEVAKSLAHSVGRQGVGGLFSMIACENTEFFGRVLAP